MIFCHRDQSFILFSALGVGDLPIQKNSPGFGPGQWSHLELTDT